jgi:iron(III) transport system substrate-binding protein
MGLREPDGTARRRQIEPRLGVLLILMLVVGFAVACGDDLDQNAPSGEVVIYTSMPDSVVNRLAGVIERRFPDLDGNYWVPLGSGITVLIERGRTGDIQRRIADEIATGAVQADIIWLAEPSPYETYKGMGLLAPYQPPADAPLEPSYVDPDGFYVAGRIISMVIASNTALRTEPPADWPDLLDIERTAFPGPESGAARATISALVAKYGPEFFDTLAAVGGTSVASNGAARDGVVAGDFEAVAVLDYMARQARVDGEGVDFAYPAGGTVLIPSPIAILADAPNPDAAKVVVDFILSRPGQEIVVELGSFYPARSDVAPPDGAPPLDSINALEVDWSALATETAAISAMWSQVFEQAAPAP